MGAHGGEAGANGPDAAYERQWARELVAQAIARTGARYEAEGKAAVFAALRAEALDGGAGEESGAGEDVVAEGPAESRRSRGMSAGARRVALFRLRKRFAEALRSVVADTLEEGADAEAELRLLRAGLLEVKG